MQASAALSAVATVCSAYSMEGPSSLLQAAIAVAESQIEVVELRKLDGVQVVHGLVPSYSHKLKFMILADCDGVTVNEEYILKDDKPFSVLFQAFKARRGHCSTDLLFFLDNGHQLAAVETPRQVMAINAAVTRGICVRKSEDSMWCMCSSVVAHLAGLPAPPPSLELALAVPQFFVCDACGLEFSVRSNLRRHERYLHGTVGLPS